MTEGPQVWSPRTARVGEWGGWGGGDSTDQNDDNNVFFMLTFLLWHHILYCWSIELLTAITRLLVQFFSFLVFLWKILNSQIHLRLQNLCVNWGNVFSLQMALSLIIITWIRKYWEPWQCSSTETFPARVFFSPRPNVFAISVPESWPKRSRQDPCVGFFHLTGI